MKKRILVVDDEKNIVDILNFNLTKADYEVFVAYDGQSALDTYEQCSPDLMLLDVMLPKIDGFEVCRRIRAGDKMTPIIMLTAREEETDKVLGLDLGADDYVTKPFSIREVMARINANMRRSPEHVTADADGLVIDLDRCDAFVDGRGADLTSREFDLLKFLASVPGKVFSREELLREVWQYEGFVGDVRAVDVAIRRLREKVEDDAAQPKYIITKRGAGYYYEGGAG
ncbi:MAG: response regulator transcription factor [Oscillospiraceae bacterium]|nr:response regulator transcription factor [Oscillospiraceae bacterium]